MVIGHIGGARRVVRVRDSQGDHMSTTRHSITAAAGVVEGEVAFVPGDEDDRVTYPGMGVHNLTYGVPQEGVTGCDELLFIGKVARVRSGGATATVHIVALVGADPGIIGHMIGGQIGAEL